MATATPDQAAPAQAPDQQLEKRKEVLDAVARRGIDEFQWRTLMNSLFPGARSESVLMVIDYCKARKLDPMKKPCHIVPMRVKNATSGNYETRDVVMPGIYEYRTTAMRTGLYEGHSRPEYGPEIEVGGVKAPAWCEMTMYRTHPDRVRQIAFPVHVDFLECVPLKDGRPNERWAKAPRQMLTKCTEAAGLREAFPDEFGGEQTAEEMDGRSISVEAEVVEKIQPAQRISEQVSTTAPAPASSQAPEPVKEDTPPAAAATEPALEPEAEAPKNIGTIKDVLTKGEAIFVVLDTGYIAGTKDAAMQQSIGKLRDSQQRIELICKPPKSDKFAPIIEEINPIAEAAKS